MPRLIGKKASPFTLTDRKGKPHSLVSFKEKFLVVYFYPKDDTPGCTIEAKEFSRALVRLRRRNVGVVGISGGDDRSKASFCKKYALKVLLLSDSDFKVSKAYGAYGKKSFMGRTYKGILRKTFILDKARRIVTIFDKVSPEGHAAEIEHFVRKLTALNPRTAKKAPLERGPRVALSPSRVKRGSAGNQRLR